MEGHWGFGTIFISIALDLREGIAANIGRPKANQKAKYDNDQ
jgi:hypothetical protein